MLHAHAATVMPGSNLYCCISPAVTLQGLAMEVNEEGLTAEQRQTLKAIRQRKTEVVAVHRSKKAVANNQATLPRGADRDRKSNTTNMRVRSHLDLRL